MSVILEKISWQTDKGHPKSSA